jgi:hypothetical protein
MKSELINPGPEQDRAARMREELSQWEADVSRAPTKLSAIRLDGNERLLLPFTLTREKVEVHWVEYPSVSSYVQCNGPDCLLCRIGLEPKLFQLLPLYDVVPVGPSVRTEALKPQLIPVFHRLLRNEQVLIAVRRTGWEKYSVTVLPLPDDADAGEDAILRFQEAFDAGKIDLASIYQRLPNETLATVPEVATLMKLRGILL